MIPTSEGGVVGLLLARPSNAFCMREKVIVHLVLRSHDVLVVKRNASDT